MKSNDKIKEAILIVVSFVIGGILTYTVLGNKVTLNQSSNNTTVGPTCSSKNCTKVVVDESGLKEAVSKVYDGVVMIRNYQKDQIASTGTGFAYKKEGDYTYIMTNQHVVDGNEKVTIITSNDEELEAEVLGGDSYVDIAVLKVKNNDKLVILELVDSANASLGDVVFTVGSPLGYEYRGSVSTGHIAGKDRMVTVSTSGNGYTTGSGDWVMKVLQTDAAINPGNSGGPLFNINGEVIGVISMKLVKTEVEGMGFAIPIEYATSKIETLEQGKEIEWPLLGVQMINVSDAATAYRYKIEIPDNIKEGVVVASIVKDTGASKSDLKEGDIITKINDQEVADSAYLRYELYKYSPGDTITITYIRDKKEHTTKVTLSKGE